MTRAIALLLAAAAVVPLPAARKGDPPAPHEFFGYQLGTERRLPTWDRTVAYLRALDEASPRIAVEELGRTTEGRPFLLVTVAATDDPSARRAAREAQRRLADPRITSAAQAARLVDTGKAVVLVGAGIHSNETGGTQALIELVWHLATDRSPATGHLLDNLIVLVVPSQNPDGQQHTAEWVATLAGTPYEDAPMPELYHRYAGHDNNRDAFMQTQAGFVPRVAARGLP
jgi:murein tripeptide amidase MpaA